MAGLAAALNAPDAVEALAAALAPRGADGAACRLDGPTGAVLDVAVRAVLPSVARVVGADDTGVVAAIAVDGIASISALDAGYATEGPTGLLRGDDPYAVVLADAERETLVLGRHGDAAGLYYARLGDGWVAASEPGALLRAGIGAAPDPETVAHFIATGGADESVHTFLAEVFRVRPDEVVTLAADGEIRSARAATTRRGPSVAGALWDSVAHGRVAVLLRPGPLGAAVLGAALGRPDRPRPLPVHTATFPDLEGAASHTPAVLVPLPHGSVRHHGHRFDPVTLDLDQFLREVGEPVPDLDLYLLWAVARELGGTADVLVDGARGRFETVARVSDRISARYGVAVRCPLRESGVGAGDDDLTALVGRTLAPEVARYATTDSAAPATAAEILLARRDDVAAALAVPRPWSGPGEALDGLRRLIAGEPVDADVVLRAYLVERWLRVTGMSTVDLGGRGVSPGTGSGVRPGLPPVAAPDSRDRWARDPVSAGVDPVTESPVDDDDDVGPEPTDTVVDGARWRRWPVRTRRFGGGTEFATTAAWYAGGLLADLREDRVYREALHGPWFVVLSGKVLAVTQRRVRPLWKIAPGFRAHALARLARRRLPRWAEPWTMQVALDEGGFARVSAAVLAAAIGAVGRAWRWLPDAAVVSPPHVDAVPPADGAVVQAPHDADEAARTLLDALRYSLPPDLVASLVGCAVVSADDTGARLLGYAVGPFADAVPHAPDVILEVCDDNPAGQGRERTPVLLVFEAPTPPRRDAADEIVAAARP